MTTNALITGWGMYAPSRVMTNEELSTMVETSDEWIVSRTGIRERRIAADDETTATLSVHASRDALAVAGLDATDLDLIILGTCTPDYYMPSTAVLVGDQLGATRSAGFDVMAACSGFIFSLATATAFVRSGMYRNVLVLGVELLSRFLDYTDRNTCVLFGDGAGAVIVSASEQPGGLMGLDMYSDGSGANGIIFPAGGSARPDHAPDRGGGRPLRAHGGQGGLQVRHPAACRVVAGGVARGWPDRRRRRPVPLPPGQYPDHRERAERGRHPGRQDVPQHRALRQHERRIGPDGARRGDRGGSHPAGRPAPHGRVRRGLHRRSGGGRVDRGPGTAQPRARERRPGSVTGKPSRRPPSLRADRRRPCST